VPVFCSAFLSVYATFGSKVVYKVAVTGDLESIKRRLAEDLPYFYNLEPVMKEDKVSRGIWKLSGVQKACIDSATITIRPSSNRHNCFNA
jgi:hypothetical protein